MIGSHLGHDVVCADVVTDNAIVHLIDRVLQPADIGASSSGSSVAASSVPASSVPASIVPR